MDMEKLIYLGLVVWLIWCCGIVNAETYYYDNCTDCTENIHSASKGEIVYLTTDIEGQSEFTISSGNYTFCLLGCVTLNGISGITFDCQWNLIENYSMIPGIHLKDSSNNVIKNCKIYQRKYGIVKSK